MSNYREHFTVFTNKKRSSVGSSKNLILDYISTKERGLTKSICYKQSKFCPEFQSMRKDLREQYLSIPRYQRYLIATKSDDERAQKLYNANVTLSQGFHPLISQFEVVFRNGIDSVLTGHFRDTDWIINPHKPKSTI